MRSPGHQSRRDPLVPVRRGRLTRMPPSGRCLAWQASGEVPAVVPVKPSELSPWPLLAVVQVFSAAVAARRRQGERLASRPVPAAVSWGCGRWPSCRRLTGAAGWVVVPRIGRERRWDPTARSPRRSGAFARRRWGDGSDLLGEARAGAAWAVAAVCGPLGRHWPPPGRRLAAPGSAAAVGMPGLACFRERTGGALLARQRAGSFLRRYCRACSARQPSGPRRLRGLGPCASWAGDGCTVPRVSPGRVPLGVLPPARCLLGALWPRGLWPAPPGALWAGAGCAVPRALLAGVYLGALPSARCLLTAPCPRALSSMPPEGKQPRPCACKKAPGNRTRATLSSVRCSDHYTRAEIPVH